MLPLDMYYRKLAKGKARLARVAEAAKDQPAQYALLGTMYDPETGLQLEETTLCTFNREDVSAMKKRLKDQVDLHSQLLADVDALP